MLLLYDFFSSHGLLQFCMINLRNSSPSSQCANRKGHKKPELPLTKETCISACAKTSSEGQICFISNRV